MKLQKLVNLVKNPNMTMQCLKYNLKYFSDLGIIDKYRNKHVSNYKKYILFSNDNFDIKLIKWAPQAKAMVHNHASNGCVFTILENELEETLYSKNLEEIETKKYDNFAISYIDNKMYYHSMQNTSDKDSYSLHIYSPSGYKCRFFGNK